MQFNKFLHNAISATRIGSRRLKASIRVEGTPQTRDDSGRVPAFRIVLLSTAIVVLGVVAFLQYRWNSQIKLAAEANVGANLESKMIKWHLDFYGEFSAVCVALQIGPDSGERDSWEVYLHRYVRWSRAARSNSEVENLYVNSDLVKDIYVWETSRVLDPRLMRLNAEREKIEESAISPEMQPLLSHLHKYSSNLPVALRCHSPKFWPAVKSTACTLSSTRPPAMTVLHVPLLPAVVRTTGSLLSFASHTALGELGAAPATHRAETQASQAQAQPPGQTVLGLRSAILVRLEEFSHHRHPGDRGALAPGRLP